MVSEPEINLDSSFASLTSYKMGQNSSSNAYTPLVEKKKEKMDSKWKKYFKKYSRPANSMNTNSMPHMTSIKK